jgi:UDPglucose--hexose-1-phosphate uridylyltransferase
MRTGVQVFVVQGRQDRPNRPAVGCPFCVGGLEAPEPYDVRWFPNRWPAMDGERCEIVLYAPHHGASFWSLGVEGARRVIDLWAERTEALVARGDVGYVLVFENRGAVVGATIDHPHGQIYAFADVPPVPAAEAERANAAGGADPLDGDGDPRLVVAVHGAWSARVPAAATHPLELVIAPAAPLADLVSTPGASRDALAALLVDVLERCDGLYGEPLPYMLWIHQRPPRVDTWPVRLHLHLVSPQRAPSTGRYVAAGELGSGVFFNPVDPLDVARRLRELAAPSAAGAVP